MSRPPLGRRRDPGAEEDPATGMGWLARELIRFLLAMPLLIGGFAVVLVIMFSVFGAGTLPPGWLFLIATALAPVVWGRLVGRRWKPGNIIRWFAFALAWLAALLLVGSAVAILAGPPR